MRPDALLGAVRQSLQRALPACCAARSPLRVLILCRAGASTVDRLPGRDRLMAVPVAKWAVQLTERRARSPGYQVSRAARETTVARVLAGTERTRLWAALSAALFCSSIAIVA